MADRSSYAGKLLLLGDDHVLDFVVGGLGNDFFLHEIGLLRIGTAIDDLLGVLFANARQSIELVLGSGVNVQELSGRCGSGRLRLSGAFGAGLRNSNADSPEQKQRDEQDATHISLHFVSPPGWVTTSPESLVLLGSAVAGLDGVGFGHVFALLGLAVITAARLVVDTGIGVNPDHARAVGRWGLLGGGFCGSRRSGWRRSGSRSRRLGCGSGCRSYSRSRSRGGSGRGRGWSRCGRRSCRLFGLGGFRSGRHVACRAGGVSGFRFLGFRSLLGATGGGIRSTGGGIGGLRLLGLGRFLGGRSIRRGLMCRIRLL